MSVVIETTLGDITVDLFLEQRPITCLNFLKLCKMKYYNFNLFHSIRSGFIAQTGDPSGEGSGGQSIWGLLNGPEKRFFSGEKMPKIRHTDAGLLSMVCTGEMMVGSQFFFTLGPDLDSLDGVHCVIGEVTEGHEILRKLNDVICDETHRPYQDVRITHTVVLEDPFSDPPGLRAPSRSPSPSAERLKGGRIAPDEELDEAQGKTAAEIQEMIEEKEAKARATILEIVGDLPDADIAPPENVLFVCKLNPVTTDEDLEIIFSRFGTIVSCEVIRDKKTGDSLQYAFIEFDDKKSCEEAYFKMDNVLIDDRRIHVDFSQSVSKMRWLGKGRGVQHFNDDGSKVSDIKRDKSKRSRSTEHHNERDQYNRDKHTDKKRNDDRTDRNVTNKRSRTERSTSRSKTEYQVNSKDYYNSKERQSSRKNEEYTKSDKTEKSNTSDKKDKSRHSYEENHRSKCDDQTENRSQGKSHRSELSEIRRDNKSRSSRQQDDETRKEDRQSNRDDERKLWHEDQHRSRVESKREFDEKNTGKYEHRSSRKYEDKLDDGTEHKQRNRREEVSVSENESRQNIEDHKLQQRNERQSESENEIFEIGHKSNSDDYNKDKANIKRDENKTHDKRDRKRDDPEKNKRHSSSSNKYDNKESTNYNEMLSSRNKDQEINRNEERYDTNNTRHEKRDRNRKEHVNDNEIENKKNRQQSDTYKGRNDGRHSKKPKDHDSRADIHGRELHVRQERKEIGRSGRPRTEGNDNQNQKKAIKSESQTEKSDLAQTEKDTSQRTDKGKRKKGEVKRKDMKKKVINKKKSTNKKENRKRKRKPSTSSDSDSDSSDSSSSTDTSSSSSTDSDCRRRSKKRRKYSTSSSSSSSTSSSSESSSTSSSSSDSDAKQKKIKKKQTKKSKRK